MNIRIRNEFIPLNILAILLIIVVAFFPDNVFRIVLALPLLLFSPGYALIAALYPRRERLGVIERMVLSFGASIVIVPIIGLLLNYFPWGIYLKPALYTLSIFTFITSFVAWLRRRRLPESEKLRVEFQLRFPARDGKLRDRVLQLVLLCTILGTVGVATYVLASPKAGESFTEFYILDESGEMTQYPVEIISDTPEHVVLCIINHENRETTYRVTVELSGEMIREIGPITIPDEKEWEQEISFTPVRIGENQKLEFLLYLDGESEPYQALHLWLNVR